MQQVCAKLTYPEAVLSAPALAGTRPPCPDRWTPSETPRLSVLSACQPLPPYSAPPGPACRSFLCPGLSFTVVVHAFVPSHRPGSSTLFGLAVRLQYVRLQSSHGGGAPRIIPLLTGGPRICFGASAAYTPPFAAILVSKRYEFSFDRYHSRQVTQIFASIVFRSPTPVFTSASLELARPSIAPYRPRSIIFDHHAYSPCPH